MIRQRSEIPGGVWNSSFAARFHDRDSFSDK